jgi:predicted transcriptional regulator
MKIETKSGCKIINKKTALEELGKPVYHFWLGFQLLNSEEFIFDVELICKELKCSKSTVYNSIKTLVEKNYVKKGKLEGKTKYVNLKIVQSDFEQVIVEYLKSIDREIKDIGGQLGSLNNQLEAFICQFEVFGDRFTNFMEAFKVQTDLLKVQNNLLRAQNEDIKKILQISRKYFELLLK